VNKLKILIIDDDKADRINYRYMLEKNTRFSADILEADNAKKGIQLAEKEPIDCVLLDYYLPEMDGIQVAKAIRTKCSKSLPIIMLTGHGDENIAVSAMKEGINDYIVKNKLNSRLLVKMIINTLNKCQGDKQTLLNRILEEKILIANEFLENMSHEMCTPLNAIIGLTNLLKDGDFGTVNKDQKSALNNVLICSKQLLQLVTNVIDITEMESDQIAFYPEETDLGALISDVVDTFKPIARDKYIHLTCNIEKNFPTVFIDPSRFKQVLNIYLSNAIKFTSESGYVNIHLKSETSTTFRLEVEDSGIGIKPEDINKLFNTFQQLDSSATKKFGGTGLGLALVKRIVEMQGGEVGVKSLLGKGSVFYAIMSRRPAPN
jgi:signal transduction histidine kinase